MTRAALVFGPVVSVLLTACATVAPHANAVTADRPAEHLRVGLTEWAIATSAERLAAGPVELMVTNAGSAAHDLRVSVDRGPTATTRLLQPGEQQLLTVRVRSRATVQLSCTVAGHDAQGMRTTLTAR